MQSAFHVRPFRRMRRGRLAIALTLLASTLSATVGTTPAHAEAPTLPPGPTPEGRPWSGTFTETNDWTTQGASRMRWVHTNVSEGADAPSWSCTGTEHIRLTTTDDGVVDGDPGNATLPVLAEIAADESCQGTYSKWTGELCEVSATWATSGSVEGTMGFAWTLNDWTDPSQGGYWVFSGGDELEHPPVQTSLTDPCGFIELNPFNLGIVAFGYQNVPGVPPASLTTGTQISGNFVEDTVPWGGGSGEGNAETHAVDFDFVYTGPPPELCSSGTGVAGDADGDRLPDSYETQLGTDPSNADTDGDCFGDAREVASGSSPLIATQTPDTLPSGVEPKNLVGDGDAGITCGKTLFRWVTPSLQDLGVDKVRKGCVMLLSNSAANAILDYSIEYGPNITTTLMRLTQPHLLEINGQEAIDWVQEASVDANIWGTRMVVKKTMAQGLNFTRLNAVFTVAKLAALSGVPYGALWGVNQVRNKNACIQIRLGNSSDGGSRLSWSLVYSAENLTNEGLADGLHRAGVWKRKARRLLPDTAVRRSTNLICKDGRPVATGAGAGEVFDGPTSYIFS